MTHRHSIHLNERELELIQGLLEADLIDLVGQPATVETAANIRVLAGVLTKIDRKTKGKP